jgi:alginate O-acetyltransferase complex protein AlgI
MAVVCILCGFWHGANWTFVAWGIFHALFLILERVTGARSIPLEKYRAVRRAITLFIITVGWVIFRSEDISQAMGFLRAMFTASDLTLSYELVRALNYRNILFLMTALSVFFLPADFSGIKMLIDKKDPLALTAGALMILLLLPYCAAMIVGGVSSPFIYYRF